jgi:hypothetical protein
MICINLTIIDIVMSDYNSVLRGFFFWIQFSEIKDKKGKKFQFFNNINQIKQN